jgi:hypothetical protein
MGACSKAALEAAVCGGFVPVGFLIPVMLAALVLVRLPRPLAMTREV